MNTVNHLSTINIFDSVIGRALHHSGRPHPRIVELEKSEYQEDFEEIRCERSNIIIGYENHYEEIISPEVRTRLSHLPQELIDLRAEQLKCLKAELVAGIVHYSFCEFSKIAIPQLMCKVIDEEIKSNA